MTEKKKVKRAREIEAKSIAICEVLANTDLYDIAMIFGAVFFGIIHSTEIDQARVEAFADLVESRIIQAVKME